MIKLKAEDIVFFISITMVIFILIWLLSGSPTLTDAFVSVCGLFVMSEVSLWKKFFSLDKKVAIGFVKVRKDLDKLNYKLDNELKYIKDKLINIESLVNRRK